MYRNPIFRSKRGVFIKLGGLLDAKQHAPRSSSAMNQLLADPSAPATVYSRRQSEDVEQPAAISSQGTNGINEARTKCNKLFE